MSDAQVLHFFGGKGGVGKTTPRLPRTRSTCPTKLPRRRSCWSPLRPTRRSRICRRRSCPRKPTKLVAGQGRGRPVRGRVRGRAADGAVPSAVQGRAGAGCAEGRAVSRGDFASSSASRCRAGGAARPAQSVTSSRRQGSTGSCVDMRPPATRCACSTTASMRSAGRWRWRAARSRERRRQEGRRRAAVDDFARPAGREAGAALALLKDPPADRVPPGGAGRAGARGADPHALHPAARARDSGLGDRRQPGGGPDRLPGVPGPPRAAGAARAQVPGARQGRPGAAASQSARWRPAGWTAVKKFAKEWAARQGDQGAGVLRRRGSAGAGARAVDAAHRRAAAAAHPAHLLRGPGRGGQELLRRRRRGDADREGGAGAAHLHRPGALAVGRAAEPADRHRDPGEGHQGPLRPRAGRARLVQRAAQAAEGEGGEGLRGRGQGGRGADDREVLRNLLDSRARGHRRAGGAVAC